MPNSRYAKLLLFAYLSRFTHTYVILGWLVQMITDYMGGPQKRLRNIWTAPCSEKFLSLKILVRSIKYLY